MVVWAGLTVHELHTGYPLAPDRIEIKKELSNNQLMSGDFHDIPIGNVKKVVPNFIDGSLWKLATSFKTKIKLKKHCVLEFNQSLWLKLYVKFNQEHG